MYNFCQKNINSEDLVVNIDLSNLESWDLNESFIVKSLTSWKKSKSDNLLLPDFGLTAYDNGRVSDMEECLELSKNDKSLTLYRIGENDEVGNINYDNYIISGNTNNLVGNYFQLNGGYLQGFFKLYGYNYEILPARYMQGITIENMLFINNDSKGIFFTMGVRSEDKYNEFFSGETQMSTDGIFDGILTSEGNNLNAYLEEKTLNNAITNYENDKYYIKYNQKKQEENLKNNIISFGLTEDKKIELKYINNDNTLVEYKSENKITSIGWKLISITFQPYTELGEYDSSNYYCFERRLGDLKIFVNGRLFWKINNFEEFYFKRIQNHKEKQIGVPFNISWGGGSFGLKHSYHYDYNCFNIYNNNDQQYIDDNFILFGFGDLIYDNINESLDIRVQNTNNIIIQYNNQIEILGGHKYKLSVLVNSNIFYNLIDVGNIFLNINTNAPNYNILNEKTYSTKTLNNTWTELIFEFSVAKTCGNYYFYPQIEITSEIGFISNSILKIKNFRIETTNILNKDKSKENLTIEKYFDESFIGGIQKLRIYNRVLNNNEILNNAINDFENEYYNVKILKGGRLIYE